MGLSDIENVAVRIQMHNHVKSILAVQWIQCPSPDKRIHITRRPVHHGIKRNYHPNNSSAHSHLLPSIGRVDPPTEHEVNALCPKLSDKLFHPHELPRNYPAFNLPCSQVVLFLKLPSQLVDHRD